MRWAIEAKRSPGAKCQSFRPRQNQGILLRSLVQSVAGFSEPFFWERGGGSGEGGGVLGVWGFKVCCGVSQGLLLEVS